MNKLLILIILVVSSLLTIKTEDVNNGYPIENTPEFSGGYPAPVYQEPIEVTLEFTATITPTATLTATPKPTQTDIPHPPTKPMTQEP